uniref:Uncharacterized protein n=1 Tax=Arundo donax TaxID=35708 RepID=A0A0A9G9M7_ARUDO
MGASPDLSARGGIKNLGAGSSPAVHQEVWAAVSMVSISSDPSARGAATSPILFPKNSAVRMWLKGGTGRTWCPTSSKISPAGCSPWASPSTSASTPPARAGARARWIPSARRTTWTAASAPVTGSCSRTAPPAPRAAACSTSPPAPAPTLTSRRSPRTTTWAPPTVSSSSVTGPRRQCASSTRSPGPSSTSPPSPRGCSSNHAVYHCSPARAGVPTLSILP